jgi:hypothetical protein
MKNSRTTKRRKPTAGSRIIASLKEAVDRVLLAVIARHPDAVEDALRKAG